MRRADEALMRAKREGRNRTWLWTPSESDLGHESDRAIPPKA